MEKCPFCKIDIEESFKFCPHCGNNLIDTKKCTKCGYENEPNSKFCQECGQNLLEQEKSTSQKSEKQSAISEMEPVPKEGITIEFPYSTAQSFEFAVAAAKEYETYKMFGEDKKAVYRVTVNEDEIDKLSELIEQLKGWRKRTVYLNGEKIQWDNVFGYLWCYQKKLSSYKPELYCFGYESEWSFNLWGCIQANMNFTENAEWFSYGEWINNKGDWKFDKDRIRHELEKNLYKIRFCPALKTELVEDILNAIPNEVNPNKDKDWKFIENWHSEEGLLVQTNRYGIKENVYMKGVSPSGKNTIRTIMKKIKIKLPKNII